MGFLGYDGPLMSVLRKIGSCIIADVLFLLCCVPVFTAGASLTSLYYVTERSLKQDKGYIWRDFFACLRENWRQTLPAGAVMAGVLGVFAADVWILRALLDRGSPIGNLYIVFYVLGAAALVYAVWVFSMIARFRNTLRNILKNAAILMVRHLPTSLLTLVLLIVFYVMARIVPIAVLICPALAIWLISAPLERVYARYLGETPDRTERS